MPSPHHSDKSNGNNQVPVSANDHNTKPVSKEPAERSTGRTTPPGTEIPGSKTDADEHAQWGQTERTDLHTH